MTNGLFMREELQMVGTIKFAETLYKTPNLVRHGVRCGKSFCHCKCGDLHGPYTFLYWRDEHGRQRRRYVRRADAVRVEQVVRARQDVDREARRQVQLALAELRHVRQWLRELEGESR